MTTLKMNSFHFFLQYVLIQKISNFLSMDIIAEILFLISYLGSMCYVMDTSKYVVSIENFIRSPFWK